MYRTNTARRLTFAIPALGATAILPQQAAAGTIAKIKQTGPAYFNVTVQAVGGGEIRFYVVHWAEVEKRWMVTAPGHWGHRLAHSGYLVLQAFDAEHQRKALDYAVRHLTADWVDEVGNAA